jgi:phospholipid/cholesterol/gamma-HCH transport system substrate-binding protein
LEAKTNYTIVGVVVLILTAGLLSAGLWLSVGFNQKTYSSYTVYLHEAAAGLTDDAPVKYNGVQVGFVKEIKLNKNDPRQVEIILSVEEGTPITTSTSATLISQGITGVTYVGLSAGSADLTPLQKMSGEPYPVIPAKPSLFNQIDSILKEVSENVNRVGNEAQRIFNDENALYIKNTLANMDKISTTIASNNANINRSLKSADAFLANMAIVSKDLPQLAKELKVGIAKFNYMATNLGAAGKNVSSTMVAGKNTLDKISQQTIPPAVLLLRRLNAISANLEKVSNEIRQNPSVVIRGSKPPKPGPGE